MELLMDNMINNYIKNIIDVKVDVSKLNVKSLMISTVGYLHYRTMPRYNAHFSKWAIVLITKGKGTYQVNKGIRHIVEGGSLFFFYPNATFDYGPDPKGFWDEYYFSIEGERIAEWLKNWPIQPGTVKKIRECEAQLNKIDRIFMLMKSGSPSNADRASLLLESMLYDIIMDDDTYLKSNKNHRMIAIVEDISNSLYLPFNATATAKKHHVSLPTLRRIIYDYSGYPLNDYIHRLKVAEAKKILINTELPIKNISEALGYKDVYYFSRLFKKHVGSAPNFYRKNM
ncbi:AraC family transcriptional regulator [Paenibacillus sp. N3.4]|uniref:AraC family transcriptional regulator n=1 Tax=Paenibacillus sp. N3.4 TaxID=2603222 RepID=UPI00164F0681|nr:AraC family transcriptional regulator [Paenibacillus sp. N3.4]